MEKVRPTKAAATRKPWSANESMGHSDRYGGGTSLSPLAQPLFPALGGLSRYIFCRHVYRQMGSPWRNACVDYGKLNTKVF